MLEHTFIDASADTSADFRSDSLATGLYRLGMIDFWTIAIDSGSYIGKVETQVRTQGPWKTQESTASISAAGHTYLDLNEYGKDGDFIGVATRIFIDVTTPSGLEIEVSSLWK